MNSSIITNTEIISTHKISEIIEDFFSSEKVLNKPIFNLVSFCCLDENNNKIYFYKNKISNHSIFFETKLSDAFYFFIRDFFLKKELDIQLSYNILLIAEQILDTTDYLFKLLNLTDFPSGEKGYNYFKTMKLFSLLLREKVLSKRIGLSEAYLFHNYFKKTYDELLLMTPDNLSFSELGSTIRYLTEYSKKEKIKMQKLTTLIRDKFANNKIDKDIFLDFIYNLRFPEHDKLKSKLNDYIEKLELPKAVTLKYDKTFEHEEYELEIKFNTLDSLSQKLEATKKIIESKRDQFKKNDLFIFDNLFKKE